MGTLVGGIMTAFGAAHAQSNLLRNQTRANVVANRATPILGHTPVVMMSVDGKCPVLGARAVEQLHGGSRVPLANEQIFDRI